MFYLLWGEFGLTQGIGSLTSLGFRVLILNSPLLLMLNMVPICAHGLWQEMFVMGVGRC